MRINPVYQKELKTGVRGIKTAFILLGYNGLLALFGLFAFYVTFEYESRISGTVNYADILQIYAIIVATEFALVLFTVPALTASSISGEREKQTLEILLTTKLSPLQIVVGKLASSLNLTILLVFSSLPIMSLVFTIGGITFRDLFEFMILVMVTSVFVGSIGIFFSTLFKKTTAATVSTYGLLLVLGLGSIIIVWAVRVILELKMNQAPTTDAIYYNPDVGNWIYIFFINPAITCISMLEGQIGTGNILSSFVKNFGEISAKVQNHWFVISIVVQLAISGILLLWSARLLNPLRQKHRSKKVTNKRKIATNNE